jgi:hypothetical protein
MSDETGVNDPESELDNAALAHVLRALLHTPSPAPVDPAQRTAEVRAAIQRSWPHGVPPAAEPGHQPGGHGSEAPPRARPGAGDPGHHAGPGWHDSPGRIPPGHPGGPRAAQPGDPDHHGSPGDPHGGH